MSKKLQQIYDEALSLAHSDRAEEANVLCEKLIGEIKTNPVYWLLHAAILEHLGKQKDADTSLHSAIQYLPLVPQLHFKLGMIKQQSGDLLNAEKCFKSAIILNKDYVEAIHELAGVYKITNRLQEALVLFLQCLQLRPDYPAALYNLAMLYYELGMLDESLALFNKCLKLSPESPLAISGKTSALEKLGKIEEARATLNTCINIVNSIPIAIAYSAVAAHFDDMIDTAIKYIRRTLDETKPSDQDAALMYFSLGKMYEKHGDYDNAFEKYKKGNEYLRNSFDLVDHKSRIERIKKIFLNYIPLPANQESGKRKIFIVGMPRSGTSLIEQILDSHPDCFGAGELPYISDIANTSHDFISDQLIYPEVISSLNEVSLTRLAELYSSQVDKLAGQSHVVVDKMPGNYLYLGLINVLYPDAIILHCVRNPLDNCISCFFNNFGDRLAYTSDLEVLAEFYESYVDLMQFWKARPGIPILDVVYEELVADQERVTREVLEFCELDWNQSCMDFFKNKRTVRTASYNQVRKPMYNKSVDRWKRYERHINSLYKRLEPYLTTSSFN